MFVSFVMQGSDAQMLRWKHKKNAPMERTVMQPVLHFAFYVQKVIGERSLSSVPSHPCGVIFIHKYWLSLKKIYIYIYICVYYVVVCLN